MARRTWGGWREGVRLGPRAARSGGGLVLAVGAVGEAVRGSQADPVVWVAGQGRLW